MGTKRDESLLSENETVFTMDELREFLEADLLDVKADPEFKKRLRESLWKMLVNDRRRREGGGGDS